MARSRKRIGETVKREIVTIDVRIVNESTVLFLKVFVDREIVDLDVIVFI